MININLRVFSTLGNFLFGFIILAMHKACVIDINLLVFSSLNFFVWLHYLGQDIIGPRLSSSNWSYATSSLFFMHMWTRLSWHILHLNFEIEIWETCFFVVDSELMYDLMYLNSSAHLGLSCEPSSNCHLYTIVSILCPYIFLNIFFSKGFLHSYTNLKRAI